MSREILPPIVCRAQSAQPATPRPEVGVVSWNMNTVCNYRCSYCTQRFADRRDRCADDTGLFLAAFRRLPGAWEIKLSGGEPFRHPYLLGIVRDLACLGHQISIVTNFSATRAELEAFFRAAGESLRVVSASLHLEYVHGPAAIDEFVDKCAWAARFLPESSSLVVTCVATHANVPHLRGLASRFDAHGIRFKIQPEKQNRSVIEYDERQRAELLSLGGHNRTGAIEHHFAGRPCWAGARYFVLDHVGEAFRCYAARRYRVERMGSFLGEGFTLADAPLMCLYPSCTCTVPMDRDMMPRENLRS